MHTKIPIFGFCQPRFSAVQSAFVENFQQFDDIGGAVAIYHQQKPVVDLWGGYTDAECSQPWQQDTIVNVWSVTKAVVALCALRLADRGELALDMSVAHYWPEFAQVGKAQLPVRYLLTHQAGLAAITEPLSLDVIFDWQRMTEALAQQRPWWTPGTAHGYHAATFGWLVGEVVRRVSGQSIGRFLRDEIAHPLGIDFFIGVAPEMEERVATVVLQSAPEQPPSATAAPLDPDSLLAKVNNPALEDFALFNSRAWRAAEIPAANGTTNARALARLYGALAAGGAIDGVRLLSESLLNEATAVSAEGIDQVFGIHSCIGLGFSLNRPAGFMGPNAAAFGHAGYGGSIGFADPVTGIGFGFVTNSIPDGPVQDQRAANLIRALYQVL